MEEMNMNRQEGADVIHLPTPAAIAASMIPATAPSDSIFTRPVLIGAGVGFLARGVTGAIVGAILGSFWKR